MSINWGTPVEPKYLNITYGSEWDKNDFNLFNFVKTPLGWSFNIWRISVSYDNFGNTKKER